MVKFWKPAGADVSDLNRIAVVEFSGEQGEFVSNSLTGQLFEKDFFNTVESHVWDQEIDLVAFKVFDDSEAQSLDSLLGSARSKGIDGVVLGTVVEYQCEDKLVRRNAFQSGVKSLDSHPKRGEKIGSLTSDVGKSPVRHGQVTVAFKLVDSKSGEVRVSNQVTHHLEVFLNTTSQIPTQHEILEQLTQQCLTDIVAQLTPHEAETEIQLAVPKAFTPSRRKILNGNKFAVVGNWEQAEQCWQEVLNSDPGNHCALFNLSLCEDNRRNYDKAEELAMKAIDIRNSECYREGLEKIRAHRKSSVQIADQRDAQISKIFAENWK